MIISRNNPINGQADSGVSSTKPIQRIAQKNSSVTEKYPLPTKKVRNLSHQDADAAQSHMHRKSNIKKLTEIEQIPLKTRFAINAYAETARAVENPDTLKSFAFDGYA